MKKRIYYTNLKADEGRYYKIAKGGIALSSGRITESGICGKEIGKTGGKRRTECVK